LFAGIYNPGKPGTESDGQASASRPGKPGRRIQRPRGAACQAIWRRGTIRAEISPGHSGDTRRERNPQLINIAAVFPLKGG